MEKPYNLVFDDVMTKQLKKAAKNQHIKEILTKILDKLELSGPKAGDLLDSQLFIYEIKVKHPLSGYTLSIISKLMKFTYLNLK